MVDRFLLCLSSEGGRLGSASSNDLLQHAVHEFLALTALFGFRASPFVAPDDERGGGTSQDGAWESGSAGTAAVTSALLHGPVGVWLPPRVAQRVCGRLVALDLLEVWAEAAAGSDCGGGSSSGGLSAALAADTPLLRRRLQEPVAQQRLPARAQARAQGAAAARWDALEAAIASAGQRMDALALAAATPPRSCRRGGGGGSSSDRVGTCGVSFHLQQHCWGLRQRPSRKRGRQMCDALLAQLPRGFHAVAGTRLLGTRAAFAREGGGTGAGGGGGEGGKGGGDAGGGSDSDGSTRRIFFFSLLLRYGDGKAAAPDAALQRGPTRCWLACEPVRSAARGTPALHAALSRLRIGERPLHGQTPIRPHLALVAANVAQVRRGALVLDPFAGTGSLLLAAAHLGAVCFGADVDASSFFGSSAGGDGRGIGAGGTVGENFRAVGLQCPELCVANALVSPVRGATAGCRCRPWLDAIVADPPYGMRKPRHGPASSGSAGEPNYDDAVRSGAELHAAVCAMVEPVLALAARALVAGGRVVVLFPTFSSQPFWRALGGEQLPRVAGLELVCVCTEFFQNMARNLVCFERVPRAGLPQQVGTEVGPHI